MVGRTYAGVLGLIAFVVMTFRGIAHELSLEAAIRMSLGCMAVFAVVGFLIGTAGQIVVGDAVRARFLAELQSQDKR